MTAIGQLTPHHAARLTLSVGGRPLAALDSGGDGPVLLMLPGYTGAKEDFVPLLDPLCDNGFRAIAVDLPGQFESPGPDTEDGYAVAALAAVVVQLLEQLPTGAVLLGHSFGGLVARAVVLAGADITGLVLLSSGPAALPDGPRTEALLAGAPVLQEHGQAAAYALRAALTDQLGDADEYPAHSAHSSEAVQNDANPEQALERYRRHRFLASSAAGLLGMGAALLAEPDRVEALAATLTASGTPVAVITGESDDAWTLDEQADMAHRLGTSLQVIPAAAHSSAVEQPDELLRLLIPLLRQWTTRVPRLPE